MKVLTRYLTKEFLKLFLLCESVFVFLFLMVDFLQKIDNFVQAQAKKGAMVLYFIYKVPFIISNMIPAAALIAAVIFFSSMRKRNEVTAVKACGLNIVAACRTIIVVAFFVTIFAFLYAETVVPFASSKGQGIWKADVQKQDPGLFYGREQIWYRGSDAVYWIRSFDGTKQVMEGVSLYFFDSDFRLVKRVDGRRGIWEHDTWMIENGIIQEANRDGSYDLKKFDTLYLNLPETPETFIKGSKKPEEMSYWQLRRYAKTVKDEGYDNVRYLVDMNIKIAFPLISFVLVLIGIPLALNLKTEGAPLAVSAGMAVCLLYTITFAFSRSLGLSGVLPPLLSAWLANLIFFLVGIYMWLHVER